MSDVLSQAEIDALLSAISTGSVDADELKQEQHRKRVRLYDFRRPNKFSKDQMHTIQVIYENYARSLGTFLSGQLRAAIQLEILSVEQVTYEEFIRSIPSTTVLNIFTMYPLEGNAIMEINPNLAFAFMDRMMGGPGLPPEKIRGLTEIELTVMQRLSQRMLDFMVEPWESIVEMDPFVERIETNPQFTQLVSPTEVMMIISMETKMGDVLGMINLCIPYLVLEPIIGKLSVHYYYSTVGKTATEEDMQAMQMSLEDAYVPVRAVLGRTVITVKDLLDISVGDVIPLDTSVREAVDIEVGHSTKFVGRPGISGSRLAVQITGVIEEDEEYE